jgi:CDP-diacylglycerol--glycerol-3-phosphate 3-phosphatidyltransferase
MKIKMNLPNKLTLFRVILTPLFMVFLLCDGIPNNLFWALVVFVTACVTDWADGVIARKYNLITNLGKFLDPLADKILVMSALICFAGKGWVVSWAVSLIAIREFAVSGIRLAVVESNDKTVIPAGFAGKLKTASTMLSVIVILLLQICEFPNAALIGNVLTFVCTALTLWSGGIYIWNYRHVLSQ